MIVVVELVGQVQCDIIGQFGGDEMYWFGIQQCGSVR